MNAPTLKKGTRVRLAEKIMDYPEGMEATIERLRACPHESGTIMFKLEGIPHWLYAEDLASGEGAKLAGPAEVAWTEFETALKRHDWYYNFSDDHQVWKYGQNRHDALCDEKERLTKADEKRAAELWETYCPYKRDEQKRAAEKAEKPTWDGSGEQMALGFMDPDNSWSTMKGMAL